VARNVTWLRHPSTWAQARKRDRNHRCHPLGTFRFNAHGICKLTSCGPAMSFIISTLSWLSSHTTFSCLQVHPPLRWHYLPYAPIVHRPRRATLRRCRLLCTTARDKHVQFTPLHRATAHDESESPLLTCVSLPSPASQ
jgi:hypothetical protein